MNQNLQAVPPTTGYHHLGLTVRDIDVSEKWYAEVFGLERAFVEPHHAGTGYAVVMNIPGSYIFLGLDKHDANQGELFEERRTGLDHLSLGVASRADMDRWVDHLDALGVEHAGVTEVTEPFPAATLCFRDPDNIALELTWM